MKKYFTLFLIAISFSALGQNSLKKINFRTYPIPVSYWQYATNPLGDAYKTYNLKVNTENDILTTYIKNQITIKGLQKVEEEAPLTATVTIKNFEFFEPEVKENKIRTKDGQVDHIEYYISLEYIYNIEAYLMDNINDKKLYTSQLQTRTGLRGEPQPERWDKNCTNETDARNILKRINSIKKEITEKILTSLCWNMSAQCTFNYGEQLLQTNAPFLTIDEKNFFEHYFCLRYMKGLSNTLKKMNGKTPLNNFSEELADPLTYLKNLPIRHSQAAPTVYNRIKAASLYNIGLVYLYHDDYVKALEYAQLMKDTGELEYEGKELKKMAEELKNILIKNNKTSRHQ